MFSGFESVLWEDLQEIETYSAEARVALDNIVQAISEGWISQPTREDTKRLSRLVALSDILQNEMKQWAAEVEARRMELQAFNRRNGKR